MEALTHQQEREGVALLERRGGAGRAVRGRRGCQKKQPYEHPMAQNSLTHSVNIQCPKHVYG
jgi:hypothetical protein